MKIHIVHEVTDREGAQETKLVSAHVDEMRATTVRHGIDRRGENGVYGVVESVELDMTGVTSDEALEITNAAGFELIV